jgi:hypothetical protein
VRANSYALKSEVNPKSLLVTILVAFVTVFATDFLVHQLWLGSAYKATASLWRPEAEMMARMPWMLLGQFLAAAAFTTIFAACVAEQRLMSRTIQFAACMGIFVSAGQLMTYVVQPVPGALVARWLAATIVQAVVLGVIVHKVYKPAPIAAGK